MKRIRIGKDMFCTWTILTNGSPTSLDGRILRIEVKAPDGSLSVIEDYETEGNKIMFTFGHDIQRMLGVYGLTLWENYGALGQTAVDKCKAFELVDSTEKERDEFHCEDKPHHHRPGW